MLEMADMAYSFSAVFKHVVWFGSSENMFFVIVSLVFLSNYVNTLV